MMSFYDRKGPESWSQGIVPHFITCNTFIGRNYAKVLQGFIADCYRQNPTNKMKLNENEPLYIIELGCGSGKFSYIMLKALKEMQSNCLFPYSKIVYVMTDFTEQNFNFWSNHPSLKPFFESGNLDAAIFDAVSDNEIKCWKSGKILNFNVNSSNDGVSVSNPMVVIANYLFDTLCHDIFQVEGGRLKEGLISVGSKQDEAQDPLNPDIINRLDNLYEYKDIVDPLKYYREVDGFDNLYNSSHTNGSTGEASVSSESDSVTAVKYDDTLNSILAWYQEHYKNEPEGASVLFPVGALKCLKKLSKISNNRLIVISGDKGNNNTEQFVGLSDPHIAVHGSFSLMVNYHAIGLWFTNQGGFSIHNPQEEASLKVSCFVLDQPDVSSSINANIATTDLAALDYDALDKQRAQKYATLAFVFDETINLFGPNDFFILQKSLKEDMTAPPLRTVLALLKLSDWDPDIFFKFRDSILNNAPTCNTKLKNDLCRGVPRVWENHYVLDLEKDIAFEIGRFYYGIKNYEQALHYYAISIEQVGKHHVTYHNQGLCYYSLNQFEVALDFFRKAYELDNTYEKAKNWIEKVNKERVSKIQEQQTLLSQEAQLQSQSLLTAYPVDGVVGASDFGIGPSVGDDEEGEGASNTVERLIDGILSDAVGSVSSSTAATDRAAAACLTASVVDSAGQSGSGSSSIGSESQQEGLSEDEKVFFISSPQQPFH